MNTPLTSSPSSSPSKGFSIAALVLGIVSAATGIIPYFSLPTGILAIIFASISLKQKLDGRGMALAGLITGIVGTSFGLLIAVVTIISLIVGSSYDAGSMPATV